MSTPAVGSDGSVYVGSGSRHVHCIKNGASVWDFVTSGAVWSSPVLDASNTLFVGSGAWSTPLVGLIVCNLCSYCVADDGNLYGLDAISGVELWRFATGEVAQLPL